MKIENRKARFDYHIEEVFTAGISLLGTEVKAIKDGRASLVDSFCFFHEGSLLIKGMNVTVAKNAFQHDPLRERALLLKRKELEKLEKGTEKGISVVPLQMYIKAGWIKIDVALVKGKKDWDKRQTIKDRDSQREIKRITG
jgi:SsrA-binding protein